jgi:hypothetical protein
MKKLRVLSLILISVVILCSCHSRQQTSMTTGEASTYQQRSFEGVSMIVHATPVYLTYTINSDVTKILFSEYWEDMTLEQLSNGQWMTLPIRDEIRAGVAHMIELGDTYTNTIRWDGFYPANLDAGTYRLIFSFDAWLDDYNIMDGPYNIVSEFSID